MADETGDISPAYNDLISSRFRFPSQENFKSLSESVKFHSNLKDARQTSGESTDNTLQGHAHGFNNIINSERKPYVREKNSSIPKSSSVNENRATRTKPVVHTYKFKARDNTRPISEPVRREPISPNDVNTGLLVREGIFDVTIPPPPCSLLTPEFAPNHTPDSSTIVHSAAVLKEATSWLAGITGADAPLVGAAAFVPSQPNPPVALDKTKAVEEIRQHDIYVNRGQKGRRSLQSQPIQHQTRTQGHHQHNGERQRSGREHSEQSSRGRVVDGRYQRGGPASPLADRKRAVTGV